MEWLLRALLRLAPMGYRRRYGDSVMADYHAWVDEMREEQRPTFPLAVKAVVDLLLAIAGEHMTNGIRSVTYALRSLAHTPGVALAMIFTLALGIGANVAAFTVINGVLLSPLPYPQSNRMVAVWRWTNDVECTQCSNSLFTSFAYRDRNSTFESLAPYAAYSGIISNDGPAVKVDGAAVGAQFMDVVGMRAQLGRGFAISDESASAANVVMLSDSLWAARYNRDPSVIGRNLTLDGKPARIIGIMPQNFLFPNFKRAGEHPAFFIIAKRMDLKPGVGGWGIVGRLKQGASSGQAAGDLDRIIASLANAYPSVYRKDGRIDHAVVVPLADDLFGPMRVVLLPLFGAVFIVLVIACVNVANLLIARTVGRQRDIAMRLALGAKRSDVVREVLTEAMVLAFAAACIGLAGAYYAVQGYAALHPAGIHRLDRIAIDGRVIVYAVGVAALCAIATSILPTLVLMRGPLFASLKDGRSRAGSRGSRARSALVVIQIACAFSLVVACGLLVRSLQAYADVDLGFNARNLVVIQPPQVSEAFLPDQVAQTQYFERLQRNLAALPGVVEVAHATAAPISDGAPDELVNVVRGPKNADGLFEFVSPKYFATLGVPVVRGRAITARDTAASRPVAVVNEAFVRRFIGNGDPIGREFVNGDDRFTIVGVVPTVAIDEVGEQPQPAMYFALAQLPVLWHTTYAGENVPFVVRLRVPLATIKDSLLAAWRAADPREPLPAFTTMEQLERDQTANTRANAFVLGVLALIALLLAISGTASVAAYSAARRTGEIGVRMALGAEARDIVNMLLGGAALLLAAGLAIGLLLAAVASNALRPQLFGTPEFDPVTYGAVALVLIVATMTASFVPAYRATFIDPAKALRYE
jgi:putative ABC transport system permease protein